MLLMTVSEVLLVADFIFIIEPHVRLPRRSTGVHCRGRTSRPVNGTKSV
jgi:hypothetical protein